VAAQSNGPENLPENNTQQHQRSDFWDRMKSIPAGRLAWLWLLIGFLLLPFTSVQTVIPLAAWLAPIFMLRFARTSPRARIALPLIFFAYAVALLIGFRGSGSSSIVLYILGILSLLVRDVMYTLPYAADRLIGPRLPSWARLFVFPLAFTTVDWLISLSKIMTSSGSPAYSQYDNLPLLQILSITGMWGVTFLIMWGAATINAAWEHLADWRGGRAKVITYAAVLLAIILCGSGRLAFTPPPSQTVQAATITLDNAVTAEANSFIDVKFNQSTDAERAAARPKFEATVDQLLGRTETALSGGARIVGWQEGAAIVLEEDEPQVLARVAALAKQYDAYIQISLALLTRSQSQFFVRNQSILVDNTGAILWTYDKTYLVFPVESSVMIAGPGKLPVAATPYGRLSTAICNDLHFTSLINQAGQQHVDILIAPYHSAHPWEAEDAVVATYRAIENGFSLVRPAGTGVSTITDYQGRILGSQNYYTNTAGIMLSSVPTRGTTTIYSLIGDLFAYLCAAGLALLIVWALIRPRPAIASVQISPKGAENKD
jgi:apolipoprotein N-acyltransferase